MVRNRTVLVWSNLQPKKSLVVSGWWWWVADQRVYPRSRSLDLGPFGPDLDLTWDLDLKLDNKILFSSFLKIALKILSVLKHGCP